MNTIVGERPKAPWHLWAVGLVGLLWFAGGAYDYVQTQSRNMDYIGAAADAVGLPAEVILDYFHSYPLWADICWALGVWGSIAGGVLLLLRSRFAFHALVISLIGLAGSTLYTFIADVAAGDGGDVPDRLYDPDLALGAGDGVVRARYDQGRNLAVKRAAIERPIARRGRFIERLARWGWSRTLAVRGVLRSGGHTFQRPPD